MDHPFRTASDLNLSEKLKFLSDFSCKLSEVSDYSDMIPRNRSVGNDPSYSEEVNVARKSLARKGWSYRALAAHLGLSYTQVSHVLTGRRQSRRLLAAIEALPEREV